ncbi:MAG TPA: hypothetical protein VNR51_05050 [Hyphomicrobium sp.]|nr:hypothetical protein [Hyphomicrobium sp.]
MAAVSAINSALSLLRSAASSKTAAPSAVAPVAAPGTNSAGILDAIKDVLSSNQEIKAQYDAFYQTARENPLIHDDNARHIALVETISANRHAFPPGEFSIRTVLPNGASITTRIPAAGETSNRSRAAYATSVKAPLHQVVASESPAKLNAMARIAEVVALNTRALDAAPLQQFQPIENTQT